MPCVANWQFAVVELDEGEQLFQEDVFETLMNFVRALKFSTNGTLSRF